MPAAKAVAAADAHGGREVHGQAAGELRPRPATARTARSGCSGAMAEGREGFPRLRGDVQCLEQSQGPLNRSGNGPPTRDSQTQCKRQGPTGQDQPADPVRVGAKQLVQPGRLGGLIKTQPPAVPGQIKAPPLPLQPTPPPPPRPAEISTQHSLPRCD